MPKKDVTMTDVARRAGVSISTVSRVINGTVPVSDDLREQILVAIRESGYVPVRANGAINSEQVSTIAIIVPALTGPFFANIIRGIQNICFDNGHTAAIYSSDNDPEKEIIHVDELRLQPSVKGVIFVGTWTWEPYEHVMQLYEQGMLICLINRHIPDLPVDLVEVDKNQGVYDATSHLLALGHQRIGCIVGIPSSATVVDQVAGYRRALQEYGVTVDENLILETPLSAQGGYNAANTLLTTDNPPSAIFSRSDRHALGILRAAHDLSIVVPDQLSIVGHDDEPDAAFWNPPLTSIRQPQYEMGIKAATLLFERMKNPELPQRQAIIQPQLIVRKSTALPPDSNTIQSVQEAISHE